MKRTHPMKPGDCFGRLAMTCLIFLLATMQANAQINNTRNTTTLIDTTQTGTIQTNMTKFNYEKPLFDFDYKKPVFKLNEEQSENTSKFLRFSVLTGYREGIKPSKGMVNFDIINDDKAGTSRYCMYNLSIQDMLTNSAKPEQVILNVKDPSKYRHDPKYGSEQDWLRKNGYCYEITLPSAVYTVKTMDMIREDCARQFHVRVTYEVRNEKELYTITEIQ